MKLDEYIKEQEATLKKFKKFWLDGQKNQPDLFPEELESGEWDEQLQVFGVGQ